MMDQLSNNKELLEDTEKRLEEERIKKLEQGENRRKALREAGISTDIFGMEPCLMNNSDDPTLGGVLIYPLKEGETKVGTAELEENDIKINALGMHKRHCIFTQTNGEVYIEPGIQDCKVLVNGTRIKDRLRLKHLDRIVLGSGNSYKLIIPGEKAVVNQSLIRYG